MEGSSVSNTANGTGRRILVGVDGSDNSKEALRQAIRFGQALGASVEAIMCWDSPYLYESYDDIDPARFSADKEKLFAATLREVFGEDLPQKLTPRLVRGQAAATLIAESEDAQLLIVGRRGVGGVLGTILGSVSSAVVSHAKCPVLVVHQ